MLSHIGAQAPQEDSPLAGSPPDSVLPQTVHAHPPVLQEPDKRELAQGGGREKLSPPSKASLFGRKARSFLTTWPRLESARNRRPWVLPSISR